MHVALTPLKINASTALKNLVIFNEFHHTSQTATETLSSFESLGSFSVSANVSVAATSRLGLGSEGLMHIPASVIDLDLILCSLFFRLTGKTEPMSQACAYRSVVCLFHMYCA